MFVHLKTGKPAWLISHDAQVVYSLGAPDDDKPHHTVDSFDFFATHREATGAEISEFSHPDKPRQLASHAAPKPLAARKAHKAPGKARKAAPAKATTRGADKPPALPQGAGGEPHGE